MPTYSVPRGKGIMFIACSYLHFQYSYFLRGFFFNMVQSNINDFETDLFDPYMGL